MLTWWGLAANSLGGAVGAACRAGVPSWSGGLARGATSPGGAEVATFNDALDFCDPNIPALQLLCVQNLWHEQCQPAHKIWVTAAALCHMS